MGALKGMEIGIRRAVVRLLSRRRRSNPVPHDLDFNACRFLFVRQDRIGDVLVSTPLFSSLHTHYPDARLDVIVSPNNLAAVEHNPIFTRRWLYTKKIGRTISLFRAIRRERYDFAVDLMDNPSATSTLFMLLSGARWNVGLEKENAKAYDVVVPLRSRKEVHIVERLAEILKVFRIDPEQEELRITYVPAGDSFAVVDELFRSRGLQGQRVVAVNISAGSEARFWGIENFRRLIQRMAGEEGELRFVVLAKPGDKGRAADIARDLPNVVCCSDFSFDEFAAAIARSSALMTPDTAAVHLAAAGGVPAVVLYVQSDPDLRIWEPYRSQFEAVVTKSENLASVSVDNVFAAFLKLRERAALRPAGVSKGS